MDLKPRKARMRPTATVEEQSTDSHRASKATDDDDLDDDLDDVDDYDDEELPDVIPHG
jgi:hypothetical protein